MELQIICDEQKDAGIGPARPNSVAMQRERYSRTNNKLCKDEDNDKFN